MAIVLDLLYDSSPGNIFKEENLARSCGELARLLVENFLNNLLEQSVWETILLRFEKSDIGCCSGVVLKYLSIFLMTIAEFVPFAFFRGMHVSVIRS